MKQGRDNHKDSVSKGTGAKGSEWKILQRTQKTINMGDWCDKLALPAQHGPHLSIPTLHCSLYPVLCLHRGSDHRWHLLLALCFLANALGSNMLCLSSREQKCLLQPHQLRCHNSSSSSIIIAVLSFWQKPLSQQKIMMLEIQRTSICACISYNVLISYMLFLCVTCNPQQERRLSGDQ